MRQKLSCFTCTPGPVSGRVSSYCVLSIFSYLAHEKVTNAFVSAVQFSAQRVADLVGCVVVADDSSYSLVALFSVAFVALYHATVGLLDCS